MVSYKEGKEPNTKKRSRHLKGASGKRKISPLTVILVLIMIAGIGILSYPFVSDYWNSYNQSKAIMTYMDEVSEMDTSDYESWIESARQYNQQITKNGPKWAFTEEENETYNREMAYNAGGSMGYITIGKLGTMLSIYHGTSDAVLRTGVGHVEGSSLPVGSASWDAKEGRVMDPNEGVHIVLSGHRGLPSAKLFSDIDKLEEGDIFTLNILNETLTFQVDQIRVVEPADLSNLQVYKGYDYCTLVTCTPYGINTHRLLVRGKRVATVQGEAKLVADALQIRKIYIVPFIIAPIMLLLLILAKINSVISNRQRKRIKELQERINRVREIENEEIKRFFT